MSDGPCTNRNSGFNPLFPQTTADLRNELAKENIQILASETFAEDPTAQIKSLKVSYHLPHNHTAVKRKNPTPLPVFAASNFVRV